jgi:hypothetical protein
MAVLSEIMAAGRHVMIHGYYARRLIAVELVLDYMDLTEGLCGADDEKRHPDCVYSTYIRTYAQICMYAP